MTLPGLTKEQIMAVDRIMVENLDVPVELMMEHAGSTLARLAVQCRHDETTTFRIIVGSGNNGAGGMVAARRLFAWGYNVEVYAPRGVISFRRIPAGQYVRLRSLSVPVSNGMPSEMSSTDVVLDAYLGYGFVSRDDEITDNVFEYLAQSDCTVCLDVPSGLNPDTGDSQADLKPTSTLTIAFVKEGLLKAYPDFTGDLYICDIGVPMEVYQSQIGLGWEEPFTKDSLSQLVKAFQVNSMASVEIVERDGIIGWLPSFVSK